MPSHCYKFLDCEFWMHIYGLLEDWLKESTIRKVARSIGEVKQVKANSKIVRTQRVARVKVKTTLSTPLKHVILMSFRTGKI